MLKEVDHLFQMYTSRQKKDDDFLNTSRYQGIEPVDQHANHENIGDISLIGKKEDLCNLESDRSLFNELNINNTHRKVGLGEAGQLPVVEEECSRIEITPLRGKLPPRPSKS
jgi:hypothetical protein